MRRSPVLLTIVLVATVSVCPVSAQPRVGGSAGTAPSHDTGSFPPELVVPIDSAVGIGATVTALAQCRDGYLWIGTPSGLARYDGVSARAYRRSDTTLADDRVTALFVDSQGVLWVGTASGLARYHRESDEFSAGPDGFIVTAIAEDSRGTLWIGTTDSGVIAYQPDSGYTSTIGYNPNTTRSILSDSVSAIATDRRGSVWVGTRSRGITRLPATAAFVSRVPEDDVLHVRQSASAPGIRSDRITALLVDDTGRLWVGTADRGYGPWPPDDDDPSGWIATDGRPVAALVADASGDVIAVAGERIDRISADDPRRVTSPGHPTVTALLIDRTATVWIGSESAGLGRLTPPLPGVTPVVSGSGTGWGSDATTVWGFAEERDGTILIATDRHGLLRFDSSTGATGPVGFLAGEPIYGVAVDDDGTVWLARGERGAVAVDPVGRFRTELVRTIVGPGLPAEAVFSVAAVDGLVVLGTTSGVILFDRQTARYRFAAAPDDYVVTALARHDRRVWVGTDSGYLGLIDLSGAARDSDAANRDPGAQGSDDRFTVDWYDVPGLRVDGIVQPVWSIAERGDGAVLLAARDGGVIAFWPVDGGPDRSQAMRMDGGARAYAVRVTGDGYWVLTPDDVRLLSDPAGPAGPAGPADPAAGGGGGRSSAGGGAGAAGTAAIRLTRADGLHDGVFAAGAMLIASDGTLYIGGTHGASRIEPAAVLGARALLDGLVPPIAVGEIDVDSRSVSAVVATIDLVAPGQTRVEVLLDGYDDRWSAVASGTRVAYRDLPPGPYQLRVRAVSRNGVVGPEQVVVEFESRRRRTAAIVGLVMFWTLMTVVAIQIGLTTPASSRRR